MKILYFSDHTPYNSTFIRQDVEAMAEKFDVLYIATSTDKPYPNRKVKTKLIPYPSHSLRSKVLWRLENAQLYLNWYNAAFSRKLKKEIDTFNPDIIHCQFAYEGLKLWDNYQTNKPVIFNFRGYDASYKLRNKQYVSRLEQILSQKNVYSIFVCKALKENLENAGIRFANEPSILYTGVNTALFKRSNYEVKAQPIFVQSGAFNAKKGQLITIQAFSQYLSRTQNVNARLKFIGDGRFLQKAKNMVNELKLSHQVQFLGKKTQVELVEVLNNAKVFVHHSITAPNGDQEGIPNAIVEAMAMELPILSTFHSGIPEAVEHKINGLLCNEKDIESYSNQMEEISSWGFLSVNRQQVEQKFALSNHFEKLVKIYEGIKCI